MPPSHGRVSRCSCGHAPFGFGIRVIQILRLNYGYGHLASELLSDLFNHVFLTFGGRMSGKVFVAELSVLVSWVHSWADKWLSVVKVAELLDAVDAKLFDGEQTCPPRNTPQSLARQQIGRGAWCSCAAWSASIQAEP